MFLPKVLHHTKEVLADRGNAQCVKMPSDFMGLEIWGLFSDKPMIGRIQNVRVPMDPKSENLNLRKLCQNYRLHFAKQGWAKPNAKPRSKRMIPYLESEHPQILSILCTAGVVSMGSPVQRLQPHAIEPQMSGKKNKWDKFGAVKKWIRSVASSREVRPRKHKWYAPLSDCVWSVVCLIKSTDGSRSVRFF